MFKLCNDNGKTNSEETQRLLSQNQLQKTASVLDVSKSPSACSNTQQKTVFLLRRTSGSISRKRNPKFTYSQIQTRILCAFYDWVSSVFGSCSVGIKKFKMTSENPQIYHERQRLQFCLLHSLNNLFQVITIPFSLFQLNGT